MKIKVHTADGSAWKLDDPDGGALDFILRTLREAGDPFLPLVIDGVDVYALKGHVVAVEVVE